MRNGIKIISIVMLGCSLAQFRAAAQNTTLAQPAAVPDTFTNLQEKASYAIGMYFGTQIKRGNLDVNTDVVVGAMKEMIAGKEMKMNEPQAREAITAYQQMMQRELLDKNIKLGAAFLEKNKKVSGVKTHVVTLADGKTVEMQYKVIAEGAGDSPKAGDMVSVNYRGTLIDGKEFDSNAKSGKPATFPVGGVIRGWTEALQMMKGGAKWMLYIPSELAYADRGQAGIEPGSTLIFEVELLSFNPPKAAAAPSPAQPTTSDIIKVPSAEEMKAGKKIEVIKAADAEKMAAEQSQTNKPATNAPAPTKKKK
jgi:FKBP-type peptidyl-prolyl cis-trans isomerase FklB